MTSEITAPADGYGPWLGELKALFRQVQLKAAVAVNSAMLQFYWELGADMVIKQTQFAWGSGFLAQLSADLMRELPDMKGFSVRNLKYIRQWHAFWLPTAIGQQPVSQILTIPWGHNLAILAKCKQHDEAFYYAQATQTYGWSRSVLVHQIESNDEVLFYDALANNESAVKELSDETLKKIAHELTDNLRKSMTVDWSQRESVRANLRLMVKRILRKYKYPPDLELAAVELVLQQAEALGESWV